MATNATQRAKSRIPKSPTEAIQAGRIQVAAIQAQRFLRANLPPNEAEAMIRQLRVELRNRTTRELIEAADGDLAMWGPTVDTGKDFWTVKIAPVDIFPKVPFKDPEREVTWMEHHLIELAYVALYGPADWGVGVVAPTTEQQPEEP